MQNIVMKFVRLKFERCSPCGLMLTKQKKSGAQEAFLESFIIHADISDISKEGDFTHKRIRTSPKIVSSFATLNDLSNVGKTRKNLFNFKS